MKKLFIIFIIFFTACGPSEVQFIPEDSTYDLELVYCLEYEKKLGELDERAQSSFMGIAMFIEAIDSGDPSYIPTLFQLIPQSIEGYENAYSESLDFRPNYKNLGNANDTVESYRLLRDISISINNWMISNEEEDYEKFLVLNGEFESLLEDFRRFNSCDEPIIIKSFSEAIFDRVFGE